ncbi:hypothetical protein HHK36_009983 [Tetracentron sinense]|uniref:Plant heme peroxidase family profile domain-containing protein n=1 Tax=Tetracentron sinense TaxID=13715 RepID=A0A834ZE57_TETSI|nr:hypothetical protein HHK36_009983 [Tetracentron sinense]
MDRNPYTLPIIPLFCLFFLSPFVFCQLDYRFYDGTCPSLTKIVRNGICLCSFSLMIYVQGCDGSVLLDDTSTLKGEKNASPNRNSARGFDVIDTIKADVEKACPSTVSCADILTLAAREAIYLAGGPYLTIPVGRRDGTTASESAANEQIPSPFESLENIAAKFTSKGLEMKDVVVLSGAHTVGFAQCSTFKPRLFDFNGSGKPDPNLDTSLLENLQVLCPDQDGSYSKLAPLDPVTTNRFDNIYFKNVVNNSGLLQSDQALMSDSKSASMGCDGSVLLDETNEFKGEKNAFPNRNSLKGFEVIEKIKADLERACPSTVSCVDILTLAAREAVFLSGGPFWPIPLGRRDGTTASERAANEQLPSPIEPLENITAKFTSKGLDMKDVVVLSGAHTLGFAQCFTFKRRLFDFKGSGKPDPTLDSSLLQNLQGTCPHGDGTNSKLAPLDSVTVNKFDNLYFKNLVNNSGLLESDQVLMKDPKTALMVNYYSMYPFQFSNDFAASMVKLGNIGVLTGQNGQVRKKCGSVN